MLGVEVFGQEKCSIEAVILVIILTFIFTRGMQESKIFNSILTFIKLATLVLMVFIGFIKFDSANFMPFYLEEKGGLNGTIMSATILVFSFTGVDTASLLEPNVVNPIRDIPRSINFTTILVTLLYVICAISTSGMTRIEELNPDTAIVEAFEVVGYDFVSYIIYFSASFGITAGCFANIIIGAMILQTMAEDGLVP